MAELLTWLLQGLALACLALAQERHWQAWRGNGQPPAALPALGWSMLILSLLLALLWQGPAFGSLFWVLLWPLNGFGVTFWLLWRSRRPVR